MSTNASSSETVKSFQRALMAIRHFDATHPEHSVSTLANAARLSRPTARRVLLTLTAEGYATEKEGRYTLTPRFLGLGMQRFATLTLEQLLQPHLQDLAHRTGEVALAARLLDGEVRFVGYASPKAILQVNVPSTLNRGKGDGAFFQALTASSKTSDSSQDGGIFVHDDEPLDRLTSKVVPIWGRGNWPDAAIGLVVLPLVEGNRDVNVDTELRLQAQEIEQDLERLPHLDSRTEGHDK